MRADRPSFLPQSRSQILPALLLLVVVEALLLPPARLDIFGDLAPQQRPGDSLNSVKVGGQSATAHLCRGHIRTCWGRLAPTHPHKTLHVAWLISRVFVLRIAAWLAEPLWLTSSAATPPPTPPPRPIS
jgi:hypothetical protein